MMQIPVFLQNINPRFALPLLFVFLLLYGFTMPVTEEIALAVSGMISSALHIHYLLILLVSIPAVLAGDIAYYWLARIVGPRLFNTRFFKRLIKPEKIEASQLYFRHRGQGVVFLARFIVGIRSPIIITAGFLKMPFKTFMACNGVAATLATIIWLGLGFFWGDTFRSEISIFGKIAAFAGPLILVIAVVFISRAIKRDQLALQAMHQKSLNSGEPPKTDTRPDGTGTTPGEAREA